MLKCDTVTWAIFVGPMLSPMQLPQNVTVTKPYLLLCGENSAVDTTSGTSNLQGVQLLFFNVHEQITMLCMAPSESCIFNKPLNRVAPKLSHALCFNPAPSVSCYHGYTH